MKYVFLQFQTCREVEVHHSCHEENGNILCWTCHVRISAPKSTRAVNTAADCRQQARTRGKLLRSLNADECCNIAAIEQGHWNWTVITMFVRTGVTLHEATERGKLGQRRAQLLDQTRAKNQPPTSHQSKAGRPRPCRLYPVAKLVASWFLVFVYGPRLFRFVLTRWVLERTHWRFWCDLPTCTRQPRVETRWRIRCRRPRKLAWQCRRSGKAWRDVPKSEWRATTNLWRSSTGWYISKTMVEINVWRWNQTHDA